MRIKHAVIIAILLLVGLSIFVSAARFMMTWRRFASQQEAVLLVIEAWETPEEGIDPHLWKTLQGLTQTAVMNACYSPEFAGPDEMDQLHREVLALNDMKNDFDRLRRCWDAIAKAGPYAEEYVAKYRPHWEDMIDREGESR